MYSVKLSAAGMLKEKYPLFEEMRKVARLLSMCADRMEQSFQDPASAKAEVPAAGKVPDSGRKNAAAAKASAVDAAPQPSGTAEKEAPLKLPEVRAILAEKCAKGFGAQVKALIESCGVSCLKDVPPERYGELLEAVSGLEGMQDA